jgi:hypothetical protein
VEQPAPEPWQIPLRIAYRTAEKWVHVATGIEKRSILSALRAPLDATAEVLGSAGLPVPKFLKRRD